MAFLRKAYGLRATVFGMGGLLVAAWLMALAVNLFLPRVGTPEVLSAGHHYGVWAYVSGALLVILVLRAVWRNGLRTWLSSLGEVSIQDDSLDHSHGTHGHPGHGHPR